MSAVAAEPMPAAPAHGFAPGDRVRLTAQALAGLCQASRAQFTGLEGEVVRLSPKNFNLADVRFDAGHGTERWNVSLLLHADPRTPSPVGSDANAGFPPKGAE